MTRRQVLFAVGSAGVLLVGVPLAWSLHTSLRFPSDRTPEGAYVRIALAFGHSRLEDCFAYLETESQHALCTILDFRHRSVERVRTSFEEPEQTRLIEEYHAEGDAAGPPQLWAVVAHQRGWDTRMRRDLSGIQNVEIVQDRATIETAQATRYPFRRAENGIWGLTLFTAELLAHKERTARDFSMVERAAQDYDRARVHR